MDPRPLVVYKLLFVTTSSLNYYTQIIYAKHKVPKFTTQFISDSNKVGQNFKEAPKALNYIKIFNILLIN